MWNWLRNYFTNPAGVSVVRKTISIALGVILFFSLTLFGVLTVLHLSVFNSEYFASYVDDVDFTELAGDWLDENVAPERPVVARAIELGVSYFEPQIREQAHSIVRNVHRFFLERLEQGRLLETLVSQRPLVNDVATNLQVVLNIPILRSIADNFGVSLDSISQRINIDQINGYFDLLERLARYQSLLRFAKSFFIPLIFIILLLVAGIIFIARKFRLYAIILGLTFAIYGILQLATGLYAGTQGRPVLSVLDVRPAVYGTMLRFWGDVTTTLIVIQFYYFILRSGSPCSPLSDQARPDCRVKKKNRFKSGFVRS